jgi:hypothetical protein
MPPDAMPEYDFCPSAERHDWEPTSGQHWHKKLNNLIQELWASREEGHPLGVSGKDERTLKQRFLDLAQQWEDETSHLSSPSQRMTHPSYQAVLGMGREHAQEIISLLINDMKENRRQWFWALSYLAQDNPIKPEDAGKMDRMIDAWVRWEKARHKS